MASPVVLRVFAPIENKLRTIYFPACTTYIDMLRMISLAFDKITENVYVQHESTQITNDNFLNGRMIEYAIADPKTPDIIVGFDVIATGGSKKNGSKKNGSKKNGSKKSKSKKNGSKKSKSKKNGSKKNGSKKNGSKKNGSKKNGSKKNGSKNK